MAGFDLKAKVEMNKQKSQVTMLMIVGLVLFIVVSFVLYLSKSAIKKQSQQNIKKTQETAIDVKPIKEFMSNCLDKLAKDAIVLLGKQGGVIYTSQGGTLIDFEDTDEGIFFVKYNNLNVEYNIFPPRINPPFYPWLTFPYSSENSNSEQYEGYFGEDKMPPLDTSQGPHSIQSQIESFIDNNIQSCADLNPFRSQGYDISMEKSETQVSIGSSDITVKSQIPTRIVNTATKETSELSTFSTRVDIGLNNMYNLVKELIYKDISNVKFNISNSNTSLDLVNIRLVKDIYSDRNKKIKADLVIVTDGKSLIYGRPFEYIFARRNRAPALNYIRPNFFKFPADYLINESDIVANDPLKSYDPDEDSNSFDIYIGEFGNNKAQFPKKLDVSQIKFRIEVSDGIFSDYQIITVNRAAQQSQAVSSGATGPYISRIIMEGNPAESIYTIIPVHFTPEDNGKPCNVAGTAIKCKRAEVVANHGDEMGTCTYLNDITGDTSYSYIVFPSISCA